MRYEQDESGCWEPDEFMKIINAHVVSGGNVGWIPPRNIFVLDCDNREAVIFVGQRAANSTPVQARRDHKKHYYFRCDPEKFEPYSRSGINADVGQPEKARIDLKTWGFSDPDKKGGGYAVIPPSKHLDGHDYTWAVKLPEDREKVHLVSSEIQEVLTPFLNKNRKVKALLVKGGSSARSPRGARRGVPRHDRLRNYVARAVRFESRTDPEASKQRVFQAAERYAKELFADDLIRLAEEVNDLGRSIEGAWDLCGGDAARDEKNLDVSIARLISGNFGDPWRYVAELGKWVEWNNVFWEFVDPISIEKIIQQFSDTLLEDALREQDNPRRTKLMSMADSLCKTFKVTSVAKAMMREYSESIEVFDQDADLVTFPDSRELSVGAVTYDVSTGMTKDPDPDDYITMTLGAPYMPGHTHPVNDQYWESSFPDKETRKQVQEHLSLGLLAKVVQERVYSCYGKRASGKGTLLFATIAALGDYGFVGSNSTLNGAGGFDGSSKDFDLIHFRGKRVVYFDEFIGRLSEKAKTLSQAGKILAHVKGRDAVEIDITWSVWISTNERPRIDPTDSGLQRRLVEIPMNAGSKTPLDPDWRLKDTLVHDESARAAFLWTLVEALNRAREADFRPSLSEEMREATDEWVESADLIGDWWGECVKKTGNVRDSIEHAYTKYTDWMNDEHGWSSHKTHPRATHKQFSAMMKARGAEMKRTKNGSAYVGVRILTGDDDGEAIREGSLPPLQ